MRILVAAIGRARGDPAAALYSHYAHRVTAWPLDLKEVELGKRRAVATRRAAEAQALLAAVALNCVIVALDEQGEAASSAQLARRLSRWHEDGVKDIAFLIGGADGLDASLRGRADWSLAFGRLTWPHLLVRAMLAEQLYRAQQIIAGHPYHRV